MKSIQLALLMISAGVSIGYLLSGCSWLSGSDMDNPAILVPFYTSDHIQSGLALTAERRMVYIKDKLSKDKSEKANDLSYCAEAPPDSSMNLTESLSAALTGSYSNVSAGGEFTKGMASYANQLFYRTQGVQFFRDGAFFFCLARMNNDIDKDKYAQFMVLLLREASERIKDEIPYLAAIKAASNPYQNLSSAKIRLKDCPIQNKISSSSGEQEAKSLKLKKTPLRTM